MTAATQYQKRVATLTLEFWHPGVRELFLMHHPMEASPIFLFFSFFSFLPFPLRLGRKRLYTLTRVPDFCVRHPVDHCYNKAVTKTTEVVYEKAERAAS